jgi:hypothetical protein
MSQIADSQLHPLATQDRERIDLLYGGSESEVLNESIQLSRDLLAEASSQTRPCSTSIPSYRRRYLRRARAGLAEI